MARRLPLRARREVNAAQRPVPSEAVLLLRVSHLHLPRIGDGLALMPILPPDQLRTIGAISTVGLSFVIAIVLGTALGWWLDERLGTSPFGLILFFFLGLAAGILNVYRTMSRIK
jgi:hypothetical protein